MKLGIRIWILGIVLAISIISIIAGGSYVKLMIFLLLVGILLSFSIVKNKVGRAMVIVIFIALVFFLVYSSVEQGVIIKSVEKDSLAAQQGLRSGEIIQTINGNPVLNQESYNSIIDSLFQSGEEVRLDIQTATDQYIFLVDSPPEITVSNVPKTRIKTGLDISGGARALVQPDVPITDEQLADLISVSRNRFNSFGISDVNIRSASDFEGNKYMLVEVAGATPQDLQELISQQGKFEAKIGNETVFIGGERDITNVCRNDATCASITGCSPGAEGFICSFSFAITLSPEAAQRHADITQTIPLDSTTGGRYLAENLTLVLDDSIVDELLISSSLKGQVTTQIAIQGSGQGATQEEAYADAQSSMNHLQTILITGSLPFKLTIVKLDTISPVLGKEFTRSLLMLGLVVFLVVSVLIFIRYRKIKISLAVILTMFSEATITLGIAALIGWNLDAPAIAGIIAGMGTGVNDQIVLIDESVSNKQGSLKERIKRALFIILGAFLTIVAAMIPLFWVGAGLLKGFALTTIIGVSVGILITRPAFADILKKMEG